MSNLNNFDLSRYTSAEPAQENKTTAVTATEGTSPTDSADDSREVVRQTVDEVCRRGLDITGGYKQWLSIGFGLAQLYGEEGRSMYHDLSRHSAKYSEADTDRQYDQCLRSGNGSCTYKSLLHYAENAGVEVGKFSNFRTLATMQKCENMGKTGVFKGFASVCTGAKVLNMLNLDPQDTPLLTFSDRLPQEDLPLFLQRIFEVHSAPSDRDKMILGSLNVTSGIIGHTNGTTEQRSGVYAIYDGHRVYAPVYTIIWGDAGSTKGELKYCKCLAGEVRQEVVGAYKVAMNEYLERKQEWDSRHSGRSRKIDPCDPAPKEPEYRDPLISANSSTSEFYRLMQANGGAGIIVETEADTITAMLNSDYGNYSDVWRKTFHHETISMNRVTDNLHIDVEEPRLSILITCTGGQLPGLMPSFENGLGSRFLYYGLPDQKVEFHDVFARSRQPLEDVYKELGHRLMPLYHALRARTDHPLHFVMSQNQQRAFIDTYSDMLHEQFDMLGSGIRAFVFRIALTCFRYAMVLTCIRRLEQWGGNLEHGIFADDENALVCDDRDFRTSMTIIGCLIHHTARVYSVLNKEQDNPFATEGIQLKQDELRLFRALPDEEFPTSEFVRIAKGMGITEATAHRMLGRMKNLYQVLLPTRFGHHIKRQVAKD